MPTWIYMNFQDSGSPFFSYLTFLHDHVITIILIIVVFISYFLLVLVIDNSFFKFFSENTSIETIWSIVPSFLLIVLILPSMQILYIIEDINFPSFSFNILAHQWYWTYVCPLWGNLCFSIGGSLFINKELDSMIDISSSFPRLLGCTSSLNLVVNSTSRLMVTSTDVIHSFAVPSMGLKVDAIPGRVNQIFVNPYRVGLFFGQCSEICGSNHSFMPIILNVISQSSYDNSNVSYLLNDLLEVNDLNV